MRKAWVKGVMAVLCVLTLNVGIWGGALWLVWEAGMPDPGNFYESTFCWRETAEKRDMVEQLTAYHAEGEDAYYIQQQIQELHSLLAPDRTNFRYACIGEDGTVLFSNTAGEPDWRRAVYRVHTMDYGRERFDEEKGYFTTAFYTVEYGVLAPLAVEDDYTLAMARFNWLITYIPAVGIAGAILTVLGLVLLALLMRSAGRRPGREEVVLNLQDRVPYDLYLAITIVLNALCWGFVFLEGIYYLSWAQDLAGVLWVAAAGLAGTVLVLAFLLTTVTRLKARTLLRNTVIARLLRLLLRLGRAVVGELRQLVNALPLVWRLAVLFLIYLAGSLFTAFLFAMAVIWGSGLLQLLMIMAIPAWHGLALCLLCRWALQWKQMRAAAGEIIAGHTEVRIDHEKFFPDLKEHAIQLNALGGAIDSAVDERLKSERFKAELITNVSHDLKTPLTSIINYVDLLKKEEVGNPTAREYIEVLDRKSQRLKKLTEDLVEASKASTGAITVNRERLDLAQLVRQALGEYQEKLTAAGLTLVTALPEEGAAIHADGRHMWRVLDNLLNNCAKYAMAGTRVYLELACREGRAVVTLKNVSRESLNIPAERLTERFVRGDESRTAEGSGLGLSIARSLTELQGGGFSLAIDGDLFKAAVSFPLAREE